MSRRHAITAVVIDVVVVVIDVVFLSRSKVTISVSPEDQVSARLEKN
jgi:hypothetical protein